MEAELKELRKAGKKDSARAITLEGKIEARRKEIARDENMILNLESTKYKNRTEIYLYKEREDGYIRILTITSRERGSLNVSKLIKVTKSKFFKKFGKMIERDSANRRGQTDLTDASNPSMMATSAESLSKDSISQESENVNRNFSTNSEMGSHSISTMLEARFGPGVNDYLNTFIKDLNGAKAQSGGVQNLIRNINKNGARGSVFCFFRCFAKLSGIKII